LGKPIQVTDIDSVSDFEPTEQLPGDVFDPVSDFDPTDPLPADVNDPEPPLQAGPDSPLPAPATGFLETSGEAVGDDGSVVPIIGGLPAAQGSAWNIGAPADERGAGLAEQLGRPEDRKDEG
jgi:hypothetical protein